MSGVVGTGLLDDLVEDIKELRIFSYITVASTALILYDWSLTSYEELTFVWRQGRNRYVQILFVGARYAALASVACAPLLWYMASAKFESVLLCLDIVVVICSELIFVLRTWAIWERSRRILVFLIGLTIVCVTSAVVTIYLSIFKGFVTPPVTVVVEGIGQYPIPTSSVKEALFLSTPFLLILVIQSVVLALTLYRLLQYRRHIPTPSRSTVIDVLWIDGIMYFVFMFFVGVLNFGLTLQVSHPQLQYAALQLQIVLHSILSTRVVLHTAVVLRRDIVDSQTTGVQNRWSGSMRFAEVPHTVELVPAPGKM